MGTLCEQRHHDRETRGHSNSPYAQPFQESSTCQTKISTQLTNKRERDCPSRGPHDPGTQRTAGLSREKGRDFTQQAVTTGQEEQNSHNKRSNKD